MKAEVITEMSLYRSISKDCTSNLIHFIAPVSCIWLAVFDSN